MKCTIERDALLPALAHASGIAEKKPGVMPMLSCVVLSSVDKQITLQATDLVNFVTVYVSAETTAYPGVAVPAKDFYNMVKGLSEGPVSISVNDKHQVTIKSGGSRFTLGGSDPASMPSWPLHADLADRDFHDSAPLRKAIQQTTYATRDDEVNLALCGVYFDGTVAVATDKHRLAITPYTGPIRGILPRKGLEELAKVLKGTDGVFIEEKQGYVLFTTSTGEFNTSLAIKRVEAEFVPYQDVIPAALKSRFTVGSEALTQAFKRAVITAEDKKHVRLRVEGNTLTVRAQAQSGSSEEVVEVVYDGDPVDVVLNAHYVLEALDRLDVEMVNVLLESPRSPVVLTGGETKALIMPWG